MSAHEHAHMMFRLAQRDFRALQGMLDTNIFATEIFGFHAQQVVEKALKSWLSLLDVDYPRTHDLEELLALLAQHGATVPERFYGLIDLTDFAVQFRYAAFDEDDAKVDRPALVRQLTELVEHIKRLFTDAEDAG